MSDIDPAYILFGADRPASANQPTAVPQAPAQQAAQGQPDAQPHAGEDAAAKLFDTEAKAGDDADYSGAFDKLDDLASSLKLTGETERSSELAAATDAMFEQAIAWGTPPDTVREISGYLHEAAGAIAPMSAEQLASGKANAERELADVPASDIALAQGIIREMSAKIPSLPDQLIASGLGNDVRFIKSLIREGKRRASSVRR